jgi:hypothetical protein
MTRSPRRYRARVESESELELELVGRARQGWIKGLGGGEIGPSGLISTAPSS